MPEYIIKQRGDTTANWAAANPVLAEREIGWILDSDFMEGKRGDGVTAWNDLPALTGPPGPPSPPPPLAGRANAGLVPAGGLPRELLTALPDGNYGFVPGPWGLTADTQLYLSALGDDANDGLTVDTPKQTWAAMHSLLAGIDPREFVTTVNVSGVFAGNATFALPKFTPANCRLVGRNQATDGFAGTMTVAAGGFEPDKVRFGQLLIYGGSVNCQNKTIRLTGTPAPSMGIQTMPLMQGMWFQNSTIEWSGAFDQIIGVYDSKPYFRDTAFVAIGAVSAVAFVFSRALGDPALHNCSWSGTFSLSNASIILDRGGFATVDNAASMPGGGTVARSRPGHINAFGTAVLSGYMAANGTPGTVGFGGISCAKTGPGVYAVEVDAGGRYGLAVLQQAAAGSVTVTGSSNGNRTVTFRTFSSSGVAADAAFYFAIF